MYIVSYHPLFIYSHIKMVKPHKNSLLTEKYNLKKNMKCVFALSVLIICLARATPPKDDTDASQRLVQFYLFWQCKNPDT